MRSYKFYSGKPRYDVIARGSEQNIDASITTTAWKHVFVGEITPALKASRM